MVEAITDETYEQVTIYYFERQEAAVRWQLALPLVFSHRHAYCYHNLQIQAASEAAGEYKMGISLINDMDGMGMRNMSSAGMARMKTRTRIQEEYYPGGLRRSVLQETPLDFLLGLSCCARHAACGLCARLAFLPPCSTW